MDNEEANDLAPEVQIELMEDAFNMFQSKLMFLRSKVNDGLEDDEDAAASKSNRSRRKSKSEPDAALPQYLVSASMHQLRQKLLQNTVASRQLVNLIKNPPEPHRDSSLLCDTFYKLCNTMLRAERNNYELMELKKKLESAHVKLIEAQTECDKTKQKFEEQLKNHSDEKKNLEGSQALKTSLMNQEQISRQLLRTNFMRMLMVMLVSHSDTDLIKDRELANVLFDCSTPITMADLHPSRTSRP